MVINADKNGRSYSSSHIEFGFIHWQSTRAHLPQRLQAPIQRSMRGDESLIFSHIEAWRPMVRRPHYLLSYVEGMRVPDNELARRNLTRDPHLGPVVRIAPNRLVFQTVKAFYGM